MIECDERFSLIDSPYLDNTGYDERWIERCFACLGDVFVLFNLAYMWFVIFLSWSYTSYVRRRNTH